jgi:hypothetical protein
MYSEMDNPKVTSVSLNAGNDVPHPFNFIDLLNEKRGLLKQVVGITRAIEKMREALEAMVILGESSANLPREILTFYRALSIKTERQPTDSIKRYLMRLEDITRQGLSEILQFAHVDHDPLDLEEARADQRLLSARVQGMIREFQRRAKTAVSLKVLLRRRGIDTPGATLPVPLTRIREQLAKLEIKERRQRELVRARISEIHADIQRMFDNEQYSEEMKSVLRGVLRGLERDLQAIAAGGRLEDLSFSFEQIETGERIRVAAEEESAKAPDPSDSKKEPPAAGVKRMGFFRHLWLWLNTPWAVTWGTLKK